MWRDGAAIHRALVLAARYRPITVNLARGAGGGQAGTGRLGDAGPTGPTLGRRAGFVQDTADDTEGAAARSVLRIEGLERGHWLEVFTLNSGTEFTSTHLDTWARKRGIRLDFIRPGRPGGRNVTDGPDQAKMRACSKSLRSFGYPTTSPFAHSTTTPALSMSWPGGSCHF